MTGIRQRGQAAFVIAYTISMLMLCYLKVCCLTQLILRLNFGYLCPLTDAKCHHLSAEF